MKVLIACVGSRGDAEPYVAIADRLLQDEHHSVEFVIQPELKHLVPNTSSFEKSDQEKKHNTIHVHEWPFTQFDFYKYANNPTQGAELEGRFKFTAIVADMLGELVLPNWKMLSDVAKDCDLIITSTLARPLCFAVAEKYKIPTILVNLQPIVPTKLLPHFSQQDNFVKTVLDLSGGSDANIFIDSTAGSEEYKDFYLKLEQLQHGFLQDRLDKVYNQLELDED